MLRNRNVGAMVGLGLALALANARAASPFGVGATLVERDGRRAVEVKFDVPPGHHLYADTVQVEGRGATKLAPLTVAPPERLKDAFTGEERDQYAHPFASVYAVESAGDKVEFAVSFQGCDESECFFPETREFSLGAGPAPATAAALPAVSPTSATDAAAAAEWRGAFDGFRVARRETGYLREKDFLSFLNGRHAGLDLVGHGWPMAILLILVFGAALNLTPCVLPMIPVNLAIIGAGARAGSRRRGFVLGGTYGLGMALAYGGLGLAVVLTGSTFGTLQSSPWFNLSIAAVFTVLALAMFGVFHVDFTSLQNRIGGTGGRGPLRHPLVLSFVLGAVAALLAGACVAPVLVSVLVLGTAMYQKGNAAGLLLPFLLGVGMALPWPFAGAGLSFLPRPGAWMDKVKYAFGVLILGMAAYYGWLGVVGLRPAPAVAAPAPGGGAGIEAAFHLDAASGPADWAKVAAEARRLGKPVFVDFWATWCKNCHAMDATTFRSPEVAARMRDFVVVKYQAEKPREPSVKAVIDYFGAIGLPTYVVLDPEPAR